MTGSSPFTSELESYLQRAVRNQLNILISGPACSGKTPLLRKLCQFILAEEQVVLVEERRELEIPHLDNLRLVANEVVDGSGIAYLTRIAKMVSYHRRVILGDIKGEEANEWLGALKIGCAGSMATINATSPVEALQTFEVLSGAPTSEEIVSSLDLVVTLSSSLRSGEINVTRIDVPIIDKNGHLDALCLFVNGQFCSCLNDSQAPVGKRPKTKPTFQPTSRKNMRHTLMSLFIGTSLCLAAGGVSKAFAANEDPCNWYPWTEKSPSEISKQETLQLLQEEIELKRLCAERNKVAEQLNSISGKKPKPPVLPISGNSSGSLAGDDPFGTDASPIATPQPEGKKEGFYYPSVRIVSLGGLKGQEEVTVRYKGKNYSLRRGEKLPDGKGRIQKIRYQGLSARVLAKENGGATSKILWVNHTPPAAEKAPTPALTDEELEGVFNDQ